MEEKINGGDVVSEKDTSAGAAQPTATIERESVPEEVEVPRREHVNVVSCRRMIGTNVTNLQGENLGEIKDIPIDYDTGCAMYAVLSHSGAFSPSSKLFAIPLEALSISDMGALMAGGGHKIILNIPRKALQESQGFDRNNWPDKPDMDWLREVYDRFGYVPYWERKNRNG